MSCSAAPLICIPHFFDYADLLHEKAGAFSFEAGSGAGHAEVLTRRAARDDVNGRQLGSIQFGDVPDVEHAGEPSFGDLYGERLNLTGPHRGDPVADPRQGKPSDPVEEAPQAGTYLFLGVRFPIEMGAACGRRPLFSFFMLRLLIYNGIPSCTCLLDSLRSGILLMP